MSDFDLGEIKLAFEFRKEGREDFRKLIAEVERLRSLKQNALGRAEELLKQVESLEFQLATVEKENIELRWDGALNDAEDKIKNLEAENVELRELADEMGALREDLKKENVKLKERVEELEGKINNLHTNLYSADANNQILEIKRFIGGFYDDSKCDPA